jgi:hypothetical protein
MTTGGEANPNPLLLFRQNMVSQYFPRKGKLIVRLTDENAGRGMQKKRMPFCNGMDKS